MNHIPVSPYHNHFWVDFNFKILTCKLNYFLEWLILILDWMANFDHLFLPHFNSNLHNIISTSFI